MQRLNEAFEIVTGKRKAPSSSIFGRGSSSLSSSLDDLARILNLELTSKYPPAKPGALMSEPLKAAWRGL